MHTMHAHRSLTLLLAGTALAAAQESPDLAPLAAPDQPPTLEEMLDPALGVPQPEPPPQPQQAATPSQNMAVNLVALLVKKGQLTQEEGLALIEQAEAEAQTARAQAATPAPPRTEDEVSVNYVPQTVRNSIRDEIKQELLAESRSNDGKSGDYTITHEGENFRFFGDFRGRYEGIFFGDGNDNTGSFPNFNAINTGAPFDTAGTLFSPQYNVDQDRNRARLRARFGADIMLGEGFTGGLRIATGDSNSPVSPNQSLGGSGGNFSKYSLWLDRAFLAYDMIEGEDNELSVVVGRFDNPFFSSEVMWDDDLGFDGIAARGRFKVNEKVTLFGAGGLFPVYNTDFNFATNQPSKFESQDKWLYGAQAGIEWKINKDLTAKFATAYYDFSNIEGELSTPFVPLNPNDAGSTDATRPSFAQRGNTYMALRNIIPTAANDFGTKYQYQYYGLATPFQVLAATGRLDYAAYDPVNFTLAGEYMKNLAFDAGEIGAKAVNNRVGAGTGTFDGGDTAWNMNFLFGRTAMDKKGDWIAGIGYRYVESDAVVDGFTDSDFGGGGTNLQGFTLGGALAVSPSVRVGLKWMTSDEVTGPPLSTDTLQFDINAKF
ncbi:putative porin [Luteolibacter sp. GHJ8]|uniref:Porin n=1 Tax=Luteolibacter rhizosphaerae TaxID=2989719 RepID=A0ABT3FXG1_9BACT|nr:putative porin [Luteolibacter rhizosphaerae]MCW1911939.1 putative porin [Luteolibacter rhizosphaerae]